MGKVYARKHHLALKRKRAQREKIRKLLEKYSSADPKVKEQIAAKTVATRTATMKFTGCWYRAGQKTSTALIPTDATLIANPLSSCKIPLKNRLSASGATITSARNRVSHASNGYCMMAVLLRPVQLSTRNGRLKTSPNPTPQMRSVD